MCINQVPYLYNATSLFRKAFGVCAVLFGVAALILAANWANDPNVKEGFLGGLNMGQDIFNWHPVLMVAGFIFCLISAVLSYRLLPIPHNVQKAVHALFHTAAMICTSIGLACVVISSNKLNKNREQIYTPNFYTIHSFIGICVYCLYGLNYVLGAFHFLLPAINTTWKERYMPTHVFVGTFLLLGSLAAVCSGITLENSACYYQPTTADINPAENYHLLSEGCRLGNSVGIVAIVAVFLCFYTIFRFGA